MESERGREREVILQSKLHRFQVVNLICVFFIVAPYILIYVEFTHQQMHFY